MCAWLSLRPLLFFSHVLGSLGVLFSWFQDLEIRLLSWGARKLGPSDRKPSSQGGLPPGRPGLGGPGSVWRSLAGQPGHTHTHMHAHSHASLHAPPGPYALGLWHPLLHKWAGQRPRPRLTLRQDQALHQALSFMSPVQTKGHFPSGQAFLACLLLWTEPLPRVPLTWPLGRAGARAKQGLEWHIMTGPMRRFLAKHCQCPVRRTA